ncbi:MAG TPA: aldolase/citrate lyase family protein [Burkholderiales bacterium]|nr:aldolase/citrate lyase family protein [Burkholderiales bacterium]
MNPRASTDERLLISPLAERLKSGGLGLTLMIRHARTVDIALAAKTCGFDALFFDLQHGVIPEHEISQMAVAAMSAGVTPIVRVPEKDYAAALRMLDNGALGIVMPEVTTVEDARNAVAACKFPPIGNRGAFGSWAHFGYRNLPAAEMRKAFNDATLLILMVESKTAIDNIESIASVPGVDVVHIGTNDLSTDLGHPGELTHPEVMAAIERVVAACRKHGKVAGVGGLTGGDAVRSLPHVIKLGARFITSASEWNLMIAAGTERVKALRALTPG